MGFSVLPTNIGGVNLNSITGPLSSLLAPASKPNNLLFPSDLGSNPSMGHAVIISAYDYSSSLGGSLQSLIGAISRGTSGGYKGIWDAITGGSGNSSLLSTLGEATQAANYAPVTQSNPLATVSLFMPETVNINYTSNYGEVGITQELGALGFMGNAYSDYKNKGSIGDMVTPYGIAGAAHVANRLSKEKLGGTGEIGSLAAQGANVFVNPQMQLLYKGIALRTFQLEFILTPKSAAEARTVKDICDTLTFYSLPGMSAAQEGGSGQFLTPPQIFKVQFKFLGKNGVMGQLSNIINGALTNSGLGFLTNDTNASQTISNAADAKTFTVGNCVLQDVGIDYAPNGWAAYNDGYPVQTRLTLQFKETTMITKDAIKNQAVSGNYNSREALLNLGQGLSSDSSTLSPGESIVDQ